MHKNERIIAEWSKRMAAKFGNPDDFKTWREKLLYYMGEENRRQPSDNTVEIAKQWER